MTVKKGSGLTKEHAEEFRRTFEHLRAQLAAATLRAVAAMADARAVCERVQQSRAQRQGRDWRVEPAANVVSERSEHVH